MAAACGSVASPCMLLWCGAWLTPPPRSVCRRPAALAQDERLPLQYAIDSQASEAVVLALLEKYPEAAKEKDKVRVRQRSARLPRLSCCCGAARG